jgi:hypothetical protein
MGNAREHDMDTFKAGVQYGDWEGTAAADGADATAVHNYLEEKGLIGKDEFLLAVNLGVGENHGGKIGSIFVRAFVFKGSNNFDTLKPVLDQMTGPIPVREIRLELTLEEFFGLFKRFDVMLTWDGLELEGRPFDIVES